MCSDVLFQAGADVDVCDSFGYTPLMMAVRNGNDVMAIALINKGANPNKRTRTGMSALITAAEHGQDKCVEILINKGADVNSTDEKGQTALLCAAWAGKFKCIEILLAAGADVNISDDEGWTALASAGHFDHRECVILLLKSGAYINDYINKDGEGKPRVTSKETATVLYAAGQSLDLSMLDDLDGICKENDLTRGLRDLCRSAIRRHLLLINPHKHLFDRIPRLGFPSLLTEYLLYNVSLGQDLT